MPYRSSGCSSKIRMRVFTECFSGVDMNVPVRCATVGKFLPFSRSKCQAGNSLGLFTQGTRKTHRADQPRIDADDSQESRNTGNKDRALADRTGSNRMN